MYIIVRLLDVYIMYLIVRLLDVYIMYNFQTAGCTVYMMYIIVDCWMYIHSI
jgi:hypothetical protein